MTAPRPLVYDVTYVAARLGAATPTGIERVDAAFARHFTASAPSGEAAAVHYGLFRPHVLSGASARRLVAEADRAWRADERGGDPVLAALIAWLRDPSPTRPPLRAAAPRPPAPRLPLVPSLARTRWRLADDRIAVPRDAIYLNVAQYAFEYPYILRWLERRPDVRPVFFIHDILPLDHPEFFRDGYEALFERRVATMARFARAAIVSSDAVAGRLAAEMDRRGRRALPILAAPLPAPTRAGPVKPAPDEDALGQVRPYFVAVGTIEPRKNHLLLLNVWRALAASEPDVPRLVLVGARGWDNEQVLDYLERSRLLAPHVAEVAGLSTAGLRRLIAGARALLAPSFAEGYGLPLAEALAEGTPVIAADIPVFREVSQGKALLLDPTDGPGWRDAVRRTAASPSVLRAALVAKAAQYAAPGWPAYFGRVERFLAEL